MKSVLTGFFMDLRSGELTQEDVMTEKQKIKLELEKERIRGMREFENGLVREALGSDLFVVAGIDEAGRGPLAGPVAAGACILPADHDILYLNDSKKLSAGKRDKLFDQIKEEAVAWLIVLFQEKICRQRLLRVEDIDKCFHFNNSMQPWCCVLCSRPWPTKR